MDIVLKNFGVNFKNHPCTLVLFVVAMSPYSIKKSQIGPFIYNFCQVKMKNYVVKFK